MNKRLLMLIALVLALVLPASMPAFAWETIISFGDSLSDDGNGGSNNFPGYLPPGATGPSSDGPVWLNYLADSMDIELEGRAIGGAQTEGPIPTWFFADIGMKAQIDRYLISLGASPEGGHDLSGILFTVWIGGNDFLANPTNPFEVIGPAIDSIETSIQTIVDAGAEDILIMSMPNLGLAPAIFLQGPNAQIAYTAASQTFNELLTQSVCRLRNINRGVTKFYMADTFKLLQYAVDNGEILGFGNVDYPCSWDDGVSCDDAVFYDGIHPTTATHKYLAALALGQIKHGYISKEMKAVLKKLNPIHPRKSFVINCFDEEPEFEPEPEEEY
jgi:phospholipase/lecithinase/hemolysin